MKITADTLFLAVLVFLDSIELISSTEPVETTLAHLFPGYNVALLPLKVFPHDVARQYPNLQQIGNHVMRLPVHASLIAMDHVVIGWKGADTLLNDRRGDYLQPLWKLFPWLEHEQRWVFETTHNQWVILNESEFKKLGFGRVLPLVYARQAVAASTRIHVKRQLVDDHAHSYAYKEANLKIDELEATETRRIGSCRTTVAKSCALIRQRYKTEYTIAFSNYIRDNSHFGFSE